MATRVVFVYSPTEMPRLHQWLVDNHSSKAIRAALVERLDLLDRIKQMEGAESAIPAVAEEPIMEVAVELDDFGFDGDE